MSSTVININSSNEDSSSELTVISDNIETDDSSSAINDDSNLKKKLLKEPQPSVSEININFKCVPENTILQKGLPEKIIICIDNVQQLNSQIADLRKAVEIFIRLKSQINSVHQFAIVTLNESTPEWIIGFSSNVRDVVHYLNNIKMIENEDNVYNLNNLFELMSHQITDDNISVHPNYIIRVIILYSRSNCTVEEPEKKFKNNLFSPYFFVDILCIHDKSSDEIKLPEIKNNLNACCNDNSYVFFSENSTTEVQTYMAKLLAHPLQRPSQKYANYTVTDLCQTQDTK